MPKPSFSTAASTCARDEVPVASLSVSFSAITATDTSDTPGSRSTAVRILPAQAAQSIPVTVHSHESSDFSEVISIPSGLLLLAVAPDLPPV